MPDKKPLRWHMDTQITIVAYVSKIKFKPAHIHMLAACSCTVHIVQRFPLSALAGSVYPWVCFLEIKIYSSE